MLKKSPFFDFLNRREDTDFHQYLVNSVEDADFIDWNSFPLPNDYGDAVAEYRAIRESCAMFDVSPLRKYRITGVGSGAFLDRLLTRPASRVASMRASYVVFCNEDGSLKDDAAAAGSPWLPLRLMIPASRKMVLCFLPSLTARNRQWDRLIAQPGRRHWAE